MEKEMNEITYSADIFHDGKLVGQAEAKGSPEYVATLQQVAREYARRSGLPLTELTVIMREKPPNL